MAYRFDELKEERYDAENFYLSNPFNTPATNKMKVYAQLVKDYKTEKAYHKEKVFGVIDGLYGRTNNALFDNSEYQCYQKLAEKELVKLESSKLLAA